MTKDKPLEGDWWCITTDTGYELGILTWVSIDPTETRLYSFFVPQAPKMCVELKRCHLQFHVGDIQDTSFDDAYDRMIGELETRRPMI